MREYPHSVAFDRLIRIAGPRQLNLAGESDTIFSRLQNLVLELVTQAEQIGALSPETNARSAALAVFAVMRGLYDQASAATPEEFHQTVNALKLLVRGSLFDQARLA